MYSLCSVRLFSIICHFFYFFTRQMFFHTEILQIHRNGITKHFVNIFFKNTWFWTSIDQRYNFDLSRDSKITITQIQYRIYWSSFSKYALLNIRNSFWWIFFGNTTPINPIFSSKCLFRHFPRLEIPNRQFSLQSCLLLMTRKK